MMSATSRMRAASATEEPPNFMTTEYAFRDSPGCRFVGGVAAAAPA